MSLKYADRVKVTSATTGTGTMALGSAMTGFQAFSAVMANGDTCYYTITNGIDWEVGYGTYATAGNTLARTTVISSSNANALVNWTSATQIFITHPAIITENTVLNDTAATDNAIPRFDGISGLILQNSGVIIDDSNNMSAVNTLRLTGTTDLSLSSTAHAFQIGASTSTNLAMDDNEIQARNNGAANTLHLNNDGGEVKAGGVTMGSGKITNVRSTDAAGWTVDSTRTKTEYYKNGSFAVSIGASAFGAFGSIGLPTGMSSVGSNFVNITGFMPDNAISITPAGINSSSTAFYFIIQNHWGGTINQTLYYSIRITTA